MKYQERSGWTIIGAMIIFLLAAGAASGQNIVKNGSFEYPPFTTLNGWVYNAGDQGWNAYPDAPPFTNDLGWSFEWRTDVSDWLLDYFTAQGLDVPVTLLEFQTSGLYGPYANADDGVQWAELDSDWTGAYEEKPGLPPPPDPPYRDGVIGTTTEVGSISIYQLLNTLPGTYELSFAFAARPGSGGPFAGGQMQNKLEVRWDGQPLLFAGLPYITAVPAPNTEDPIIWTKYTAVVQTFGFATELRFTDLGLADSFGTLLDSVIVTRIGCGCTRTQGYWKTHSKYGPASHEDETWAKVGPDGEDTLFFGTGYTWYEILNLQPQGNAYLILAHQYIAAYLNLLSGASAWKNISYDELYNAMATAESLLAMSMNVAKKDRSPYIGIAAFLADYNEGITGPGHCFDETERTSALPQSGVNARGNAKGRR